MPSVHPDAHIGTAKVYGYTLQSNPTTLALAWSRPGGALGRSEHHRALRVAAAFPHILNELHGGLVNHDCRMIAAIVLDPGDRAAEIFAGQNIGDARAVGVERRQITREPRRNKLGGAGKRVVVWPSAALTVTEECLQ